MKQIKIELICDISEDAKNASESEVLNWIELQLGFSDGLCIGNPMVNQRLHLLHIDNINSIKIE